jgi:endoglucanase
MTKPGAARSLGRRSLVLGALAGLGVAGAGAGVLAATNLLPVLVPPAAKPVAMAINPGPALTTPTMADRREWAVFKAQVMSADGRIIDNGNHGESHSEGQGVGMLFAVAFDDHAAFDQLHGWTQNHLMRGDGLHAWRYLPSVAVAVPDTNNATDGDIYIAAALQRAARRWNRSDYAVAAARIAAAIHDTLLQTIGGRLVLLPAAYGFVHPDRVSINLSYYVFPLLAELDRAHPSPRWEQVRGDGVALIQSARYGQWGLPPDWLDVKKDGSIAMAASFPPRFSWDAVRVPLFLAWAGESPDVVQAASAFWSHTPDHPPAWVDLKSGATAQYAAPPGVQAIAAVAASSGRARADAPTMPTVSNDTYYSAALTLLSRMALSERAANTSES